MDLNEIRQEIDKIDSQLIELLERRMDCTKAVGEYKQAHNIPILDTKRQQLILDKVEEKSKHDYANYKNY